MNKKLKVATVHDGQLYSNLFDNNNSIMLIINPETSEIIDANHAASKFYGYDKLELTGMSVTEINTLSKEEILEEMERAKTNKRNYFNFRHRISTGEIKDVEIYSGPITLDGKKLLYSIIHDISKRKDLERKRAKQLSELEQSQSQTKTLNGVLPICASCKKIRDNSCEWHHVEEYISDHSEAVFTHGICPECFANFRIEVEKLE